MTTSKISDQLQMASTIAARFERKGQPISAAEALQRAESGLEHIAAVEAALAAPEPEPEFDPEATITAARMVRA